MIWQQRRAERLAAIPPEDEELEPLPAHGLRPRAPRRLTDALGAFERGSVVVAELAK